MKKKQGFEERILAHLPTLLMLRIMTTKTCRLAALALLFCLIANGARSAVLGSSVTIAANQKKTILFVVTTELVITGSVDAEVSSLRPCEPVLCQVFATAQYAMPHAPPRPVYNYENLHSTRLHPWSHQSKTDLATHTLLKRFCRLPGDPHYEGSTGSSRRF